MAKAPLRFSAERVWGEASKGAAAEVVAASRAKQQDLRMVVRILTTTDPPSPRPLEILRSEHDVLVSQLS